MNEPETANSSVPRGYSKKYFLIFFIIYISTLSVSGYSDIKLINAMDVILQNIFYFQNVTTENQLNLDNWLEMADWGDTSRFSFSLFIDLNRLLSFHFEPQVDFFQFDSFTEHEMLIDVFQPNNFNEYSMLEINRLSLSCMLFDGLLTMEIGKLLPSFGVGYGRRPTDFITQMTRFRNEDKGKYLIDFNIFYNFLNFEVIYAPNRDFIPDDYTDFESIIENDDFWLVRCGLSLASHELSFLYFHGNNDSFGLNYSSQIGEELISYCEAVISDENKIKRIKKDDSEIYNFELEETWFFTSLLGLCYSPIFLDFSFYLEFLYNGDGYTPDEWKDYYNYIQEINDMPVTMTQQKMYYLGKANTYFSRNNMSFYYSFLHIKSNDYFYDLFSIENTIIMTYPFGVINIFTVSLNFFDNIYMDTDFFSLLYADKYSEYSYFPYDIKLEINVYYEVSF